MREFKIDSGAAPQFVRALVGGLPSSGKTTFAATAPKPLFISDAAEGGYKSLYQMDRNLWWNPSVEPEIWAIESMKDVPTMLARLEGFTTNGSFPFGTIVFDPLSIYVDRVLAELMQLQSGRDTRQYYGDLANHLRVLVLRMHALPTNVFWLTHVKNDGNETNGPAIGGQMGTKFPAYCDFKWFTNVVTAPNRLPTYELRTAPFRSWTFLGGRWALPDPLIPSFKCIAQILRLRDQPVSPAVPGYPEGVDYTDSQAASGNSAEETRPPVA